MPVAEYPVEMTGGEPVLTAPGMAGVFETSDMEAAERVLSEAYGSMRINVRGPRYGMRLARTRLTQGASLDHLTFAMRFDATAGPPGTLVFGELKSGEIVVVDVAEEGSENAFTFTGTPKADLPDAPPVELAGGSAGETPSDGAASA